MKTACSKKRRNAIGKMRIKLGFISMCIYTWMCVCVCVIAYISDENAMSQLSLSTLTETTSLASAHHRMLSMLIAIELVSYLSVL